MNRFRLVAPVVVLLLVPLVTFPGAATSSDGSEKEYTLDYDYLYLYGDSGLTDCHSTHDRSSTEQDNTSKTGEMRSSDDVLDVDFTCPMTDYAVVNFVTKLRDEHVSDGDVITAQVAISLDGQWTNGEGGCENDCENLKISIYKGETVLNTWEFDDLSTGKNRLNWEIPVTSDLLDWTISEEEFNIRFTMKIKPIAGNWLGAGQTDAVFELYFAHPDNYAEDQPEIGFPLHLGPAQGGGGLGDFMTPGFTWIMSMGVLALSAVIRHSSRDEEGN